ncbi:MAG: arginyltransferase [Gammaproteobacteria bacterium]|nr:arginyltransferase [Gammaproteobacteria bacterium]MCW8988058.1 arginyltransferase [Gammaproteobacteria bacterium]MCW9030610.1 arginyltransferase [Gammaproteobacteria bacterium]
MNDMDDKSLDEIRFMVTPEHKCSYLDDHEAITLFVDPNYPVDMNQYSALAKLGFRRSGSNIYRPHCTGCGLCIPVRVPVDEFKPNRSQRRNITINKDIVINVKDAVFNNEHYALYRRYMKGRHAGGGMDNDEPDSYESLIKADWSLSKLLEFRLNEKLMMIAVMDIFVDGVSAVYTYFDPDYSNRGLGVFGILSEVNYIKSLNLDWLYLGYWNPKTNKMSYKSNYQPMEFFDGQEWHWLKKTR